LIKPRGDNETQEGKVKMFLEVGTDDISHKWTIPFFGYAEFLLCTYVAFFVCCLMVFFSFSGANPSKKSTKTNKEHDRSNEEDNIYIYTLEKRGETCHDEGYFISSGDE